MQQKWLHNHKVGTNTVIYRNCPKLYICNLLLRLRSNCCLDSNQLLKLHHRELSIKIIFDQLTMVLCRRFCQCNIKRHRNPDSRSKSKLVCQVGLNYFLNYQFLTKFSNFHLLQLWPKNLEKNSNYFQKKWLFTSI